MAGRNRLRLPCHLGRTKVRPLRFASRPSGREANARLQPGTAARRPARSGLRPARRLAQRPARPPPAAAWAPRPASSSFPNSVAALAQAPAQRLPAPAALGASRSRLPARARSGLRPARRLAQRPARPPPAAAWAPRPASSSSSSQDKASPRRPAIEPLVQGSRAGWGASAPPGPDSIVRASLPRAPFAEWLVRAAAGSRGGAEDGRGLSAPWRCGARHGGVAACHDRGDRGARSGLCPCYEPW